MAAERAAALTEAYRILSHDGRRAEYDRARAAATGPAAAAASPAADRAAAPSDAPARATAPSSGAAAAEPSGNGGAQFNQERASRDTFVRRAAMGRFRQALDSVSGDYEPAQAAGFDVACVPRGRLFARAKGPRLLGRFVTRVDGAT